MTTIALDFPRPATLPRPFVIALASSVVAHAVAAWLLPAMQRHADELPPPLVVSLRALPHERIAPPAPAMAAMTAATVQPVTTQEQPHKPAAATPQPAAPARLLTSTAPTAAP
ncbi:MAG: hypothetical protein HGA47_14460, partial [Zoogloea sp.]|nr:hypothetical protein [Zoogloea sp.]